MPETACLHIQARDADPVRVVALPGVSIRIGRASYCEVRLPAPEVADEECHLKRRGQTWHLVPVGRPGAVRIDDRPVEHPQPLPFGVPFRVGDHRLTLRSSGDHPGAWGSVERPIPADLMVHVSPTVEREPIETRASGPGSDAVDDRLTRWKARQEQRESWLRTRQEERRWEERWKAAGERLRAGAVAIPPAPSATLPPAPPGPGLARRPDVRVRPFPRTPEPSAPVPFVAREVPPAPPPIPVVPAAVAPVSPTHSGRASLAPSGWGKTPVPKRAAPIPREPIAPVAPAADPPRGDLVESVPHANPLPEREEAILFLPPPPGEGRGEGALELESTESVPSSGAEVVAAEPPPPPEDVATPVEETRPLPEVSTAVDPVEAPNGMAASRWLDEGPFVADTNLGQAADWSETELFTGATATAATTTMHEPPETAPPETAPPETAPPAPIRPAPRRPRRATTRTTAPRSRPSDEPGVAPFAAQANAAAVPTSPEAPSQDAQPHDRRARLPTAREILAAQRGARANTSSTRPATSRRVGAAPLPTICREPDQWSVPLWLGWFPATAIALVLGVGGFVLSWTWSIEAEHAGLIANRLARGGAKVDPLPEWVKSPDPKWWKTTPGHLTLWALERDRTANDPAAAEDVRELLGAAAQASPLQARVRFALARQQPGQDRGNDLVSSLALSRDVVALAWTGHQLLAAGKKEAALKAYRAALEMVAQADLSRLATPAFNDDSQIRRYAMPAEDLIGPIVGDMAEHAGWTYAEWSAALPPFAVARLAAVRALRERSSPDAVAALDALLAQADAPPPEGSPVAVHVAVQAEALALKGRWDEAGQRYRQAIDLMPDLTIRRSWWMNLAEIALRLNDESNRQKALEAAKGNDPNDEITGRAVELLKYYGVRSDRINARASQEMTANRLP